MTLGYRFGNAELQPQQRLLLVDGKPMRLGARAFDLLLVLVEQRERIVTKGELLDLVWPGLVVEENNLQVHISALRKLLGVTAIATVPGRGYRFTADLQSATPDKRVDPAGSPAAGAPPQSQAAPAACTNLPADLQPLYGRDDDLAALRILAASHRLVTIVGAAGIGKTALAQVLAHESMSAFSDGVWMVELAPVSDEGAVASTAAATLHVVLGTQDQPAALAKALAASHMLLVLDNCEHLARGVAQLAEALQRAAPHVRLLATSQEPLKLVHEHVFRLGPLWLPPHGDTEGALSAGAVTLFEARARAVDATFAVGGTNAAAVVDICRQLDGIPLAIELAAARLPLLGIEGLRARLHERFRVLTKGARLALPRHQTLRAAMDWSHGLLTADEQAVFRRLGVFSGSFGLDSAQQVGGDGQLDDWMVLEHLGALVDKSLVVAEPGEAPRYRLLETPRAFALEKLREAGEADATSRRHAHAVLAVFEQSWRDVHVVSRHAMLERHLPDLDNARAALDWTAGPGHEPRLHIALAGAMAWIWTRVGFRPEGIRRLQAAMAMVDAGTPPLLEARLLASWAAVAYPEVGPVEVASGLRAADLYRSLGHKQALFCVLCEMVRTLREDPDQADRAMREAEELFDPRWPPALRAPLLTARTNVLGRQGKFEQCLAIHQELHRLAVLLGDRRLAVTALINQEQSAAALGRWQDAADRGRELMALLAQERALRSGTEVIVLANLCMALTELDQVHEALAVARRAYALHEQAGNALWMLDPLSRLAFKRGRIDDAARMLGRADSRYAAAHQRRPSVEARVRAKLLADLQHTLPAADLARLLQEGQTLSDDEAARLALRDPPWDAGISFSA